MGKLLSLYTEKQDQILRDIHQRDWFMLILHGAVRAGKTKLNNDLFLMELLRIKERAKKDGVNNPMYILAGYSAGTLYTNVLHDLSDYYGIEFKFDKYGNFNLFGVKVITTFTRSIAGKGAIRGMTSYGAYINEGSLANREVFDEILKRCSGEGARILVDTNPDAPTHWLKVDYIDNEDPDIINYNFTIFDNPYLSQRYIKNTIASTPSGALTERSIYGRWTIGQGAIYADFDHTRHYVDKEDLPMMDRYIIGVDWGYEHYGVMVVVGIDCNEDYYLIEENAHKRWHIDQWLDEARRIANQYGVNVPFYCDTARPEYIDALDMAGFNALDADKARLPGITELATLIKQDRFLVVRGNDRFDEEVNQYTWNKTGDDSIKEFDDVLDGVRYAIYTDKMMNENQLIA